MFPQQLLAAQLQPQAAQTPIRESHWVFPSTSCMLLLHLPPTAIPYLFLLLHHQHKLKKKLQSGKKKPFSVKQSQQEHTATENTPDTQQHKSIWCVCVSSSVCRLLPWQSRSLLAGSLLPAKAQHSLTEYNRVVRVHTLTHTCTVISRKLLSQQTHAHTVRECSKQHGSQREWEKKSDRGGRQHLYQPVMF